MDALGFTPEATRTALHRMAAEGWVEPSRVGRYAAYRLTPQGVDRLEEAAARIYRLRAADWDGRWRLLVGPLTSAARRPDAELRRALRWMGFGRLTPDVWVSPHPHGDRLRRLLDGPGLDASSLRFVAEGPNDRSEDARIVATAWDLAELRHAHAEFIARWRDHPVPDGPQEAFTTRIRLVHHWRSFLFLDPGLPAALLPADWLGEEAAETFRCLYEAVDDGAWSYYDQLVAAAPPLPHAAARSPAASPFAQGLAALQTRRPA
ncbi:MAG: PaaX family transcriptional regulator [Euzebyales bacterium]|nr:PaaX family transcriptional regulator [Euzebyales bacterium]